MPANLTQQYLKAEEEYRRASSPEEELACLQVMMKEIPKHKGTDHLQADLKAKMAKFRREIDRGKEHRQEGPRPAHSPARGGHGDPAGRPERRQEPVGRQPHAGDARGGPLSVYDHRRRPRP